MLLITKFIGFFSFDLSLVLYIVHIRKDRKKCAFAYYHTEINTFIPNLHISTEFTINPSQVLHLVQTKNWSRLFVQSFTTQTYILKCTEHKLLTKRDRRGNLVWKSKLSIANSSLLPWKKNKIAQPKCNVESLTIKY